MRSRALAAHPDRATALKLPLYAVGEATAEAARDLGFAGRYGRSRDGGGTSPR